jgi:hypothetical protein
MLVSSVDSASNISTIQPRQHTPPQMTEVAKIVCKCVPARRFARLDRDRPRVAA